MDSPVLEQPVKAPLPHAFTVENAAEMARRATIAREARRQALPTLRQIEAARVPVAPNRASLVAEQIVRTRKVLNSDDLEPRERAQLLCALDKLLDRERILLAVPLPGSRRPGRESTTTKRGDVGPVEPV